MLLGLKVGANVYCFENACKLVSESDQWPLHVSWPITWTRRLHDDRLFSFQIPFIVYQANQCNANFLLDQKVQHYLILSFLNNNEFFLCSCWTTWRRWWGKVSWRQSCSCKKPMRRNSWKRCVSVCVREREVSTLGYVSLIVNCNCVGCAKVKM